MSAHLRLRLLACLAASASASAQLAPWPAGAGTEIGHVGQPGGLPAGFEASGVLWHPGRNSIVVVADDGLVAELPPGGGAPVVWPLAGDLEGLALRDPAGSLVYVGVENPDSVVEFDLATGAPTGKTWNLTPWMTGPANEGLEALTFVGGECWAGLQLDGRIFRFALQPGGVVQFLGSFASHLGRTDLAALDWDPCTGVVYALHDTANLLVEYDPGGAFLREYAAAGHDQEGVALMPGSPAAATVIHVAQDTGEVLRYESYPVAPCPPGTWTDLGGGTTGSAGAPALAGSGPLQAGWPIALDVASAPPNAALLLLLSVAPVPLPHFGGTVHVVPVLSQALLAVNASGALHVATTWPAGVPTGASVWLQGLVKDDSVSYGLTLTNGVRATAP
jgi:hypothetical protein